MPSSSQLPGSPHVLGVDGEPGRELEPGRLRRPLQRGDGRPRRLRVDVVDRDGRDAAPVVDARLEQPAEVVAQVRRHLDVHPRAEHEPGGSGAPEHLVQLWLGVPGHLRPRLRAEVLDDHLLDMAVALVQVADREQRVEPLGARLADADQDPARERHARLAGRRDRREPHLRALVRRAEMRAAARGERRGRALQHQPLRDADGAQREHVVEAHHARVHVREQARLLEHERARSARGTRASSRSRGRPARRGRRGSAARACRRA